MSIRIVISVDVGQKSLVEAYRVVNGLLSQAERDGKIEGWESSEEWYGNDGEQVNEADVIAAREKITRTDADPCSHPTKVTIEGHEVVRTKGSADWRTIEYEVHGPDGECIECFEGKDAETKAQELCERLNKPRCSICGETAP